MAQLFRAVNTLASTGPVAPRLERYFTIMDVAKLGFVNVLMNGCEFYHEAEKADHYNCGPHFSILKM